MHYKTNWLLSPAYTEKTKDLLKIAKSILSLKPKRNPHNIQNSAAYQYNYPPLQSSLLPLLTQIFSAFV